MRGAWLPSWLYELLPFGYLLFGLLMLTAFGDETLGILSGSLLCGAAALVWAMRFYTRGKRAREGRR